MDTLTKNDLIDTAGQTLSTQSYTSKPLIEGVKIIELKQFSGEDGTFEELVHVGEDGKFREFPDFQLRQVNRSLVLPKAIKAWHIHLNQEDIWYIPPTCHMLLGLWDVRAASATKDLKMRVVMGAGVSKLAYIPRGVAHGIVNLDNKTGTIIYFVNQQFDATNPDEHRLPWDAASDTFWQPERG